MKSRTLAWLAGCVLICANAFADFDFDIEDIRLQGLLRVSSGTVFNAISLNVGDTADKLAVRELIRELFHTGYFEEVSVSRDGDVLLITLSERPAIVDIEINGNKKIPTEALLEGLGEQGLREGEIFQQATLDRVRIELIRQYVAQGQYTADITTDIKTLPRNRVSLVINVEEGKSASIKQIAFVGNTVYDDATLLEVMELKQPTLLGFISGDSRYSREKLQGDLESIDSYYRDRGYVEFKIDSTQVSMTPDRKQVYVTVSMTEGERHTIDEVDLIGELDDLNPDLLKVLIIVQKDQIFSNALITASEERITTALGNYGYTFATVSGVPEIKENGLVDVKFLVNTGRRAYVRRLSFTGNILTQDRVLRREMRQMEGGWASTSNIDLSKTRLERLGYFQEVTVETPVVEEEEGFVDVEYNVAEQQTGQITGSLGYQQIGGLILGAGIQKANVAGTGKNLGIALNWSDYRKSFSYNYTNPYFTEEGVSRGISVFLRESDYSAYNFNRFSTSAVGGGAIFGFPIGETQTLQAALRFELTDIENSLNEAQEIGSFVRTIGNRFLNYKIEGTYLKSTLNRAIFATRGHRQSLALEVAIPGSDLQFYKLNYRGERYFPIINDRWAIRLRTALGYGNVYGDTETFPFYEHFFAGGFNSIRGYERYSLGPRSTPVPGSIYSNVNGQPYGGNVLTEFSAELIFPLPFVEQLGQIRSLFFLDGGNVFLTECPPLSLNCIEPSTEELRYSAGLGVSWNSRMGPMSFSLSQPFNNQEFDEDEVFSFELSQFF